MTDEATSEPISGVRVEICGYLDEIYEGLPCPGGTSGGNCDPTKDTPIIVNVNTTTPILFNLTPAN